MFNNYKNKILPLVILIVFTTSFGLLIGVLIGGRNKETKTESHEQGYSYISPLIECFSDKSDTPENYKLQSKIEELINQKIKTKEISEASVYFRDLANGPWIGVNEGTLFSPASLLKVPIMITYYRLAENNPEILNKKITVDNIDHNETIPNIKPEKFIEAGKTYTIQELINYMIIESDNHASFVLINNLEADALNKTFNDLGINTPSLNKPENYMTVKEYASFFRVLYNASYLNKNYSEKALSILAQSKYKNGLVAGLPINTKIAHKFGEREVAETDQLHDCGIVYKPHKDYLICVMTRGNDFSTLTKAIQDLSSLVYQNIN